MRVLVCGSRHYNGFADFSVELNKFDITEIIEGGAKGVDSMAFSWAREHNIPVKSFSADWNKHEKAAGPIRNQQMLDEGKPDLVIAFLAKGSRGTKNMIEQATKANVPVRVINI